jgi:hypothetical protein
MTTTLLLETEGPEAVIGRGYIEINGILTEISCSRVLRDLIVTVSDTKDRRIARYKCKKASLSIAEDFSSG